jgi:Acyl-CoA reductase (LuxC)
MVKTPVRSIVGAIADAAARWSEAGHAPRLRARAAVVARTGYAAAAVDYAFDRLFGSLTRSAIEAVIAAELGSLDVLDGFVGDGGRPRFRALPVGRVCIISSRTTVGVAIVPAIFALCAKCTLSVKDREDALAAAFFATLLEELVELRGLLDAKTWNGAAQTHSLDAFDAVVAFGNDATLAQIAVQVSPSTRFIAYGAKASAGYVTRTALRSEDAARSAASGAALDILLYEGEGCLSLHALFVEREGAVTPQRFGEILAGAIVELTALFPPGARDEAVAAKVAAARDLSIFRRSAGATAPGSSPDGFVVAMDPPAGEPPLFLPRVIGVRSVGGPDEALAYLQRHGVALEGLAVSEHRDDLVAFAEAAGVSRITTFGSLQAPPLAVFHGGRPRIAEFVRWVSDET